MTLSPDREHESVDPSDIITLIPREVATALLKRCGCVDYCCPMLITCVVLSFMDFVNPTMLMFDRELHTSDYLQTHSLFLLVTVLMGACKHWRPDLYPALRACCHKLVRT